MTFARRSHGLIPMSRLSRRGRRPSRAHGLGLGLECCEGRMLLSTAMVSVNAAGTAPGNSVSDFSNTTYGGIYSSGPSQSLQGNLSADGTKLVFASEATDLVASLDDTNHASDVFVRDLTTGQTTLVSATPGGQTGNGASFDPVISPNGRYVAFLSDATNLSTVPASPTGLSGQSGAPYGQSTGYLYVRDLQAGTTTLLDQTPVGVGSDGLSTGQFVFSPNSQSLAFIDTSDDLTGAAVDRISAVGAASGLAPKPSYVYVRDLAGQTTSLVSASTGGQASGNSSTNFPGMATDLVFSPDSRSLVFDSTATDLTANPPNNSPNPTPGSPYQDTNVFLRDLSAGTTTLLSVTTDGQLAMGNSTGAVFSPDGRSVAFTSTATDLTGNAADTAPPGGSNGLSNVGGSTNNVFVRNLTTGTTTLVSATPGGLMSDGYAMKPVFSPDGQSLAYLSNATDLTSNPLDSNPPPSTSPSPGSPSLPISAIPIVPPNPGLLPGSSPSSGSIPAPFPTENNVFLTNLATGTTSLVSVTPDGQLSSGAAGEILFSPDGRYLAFTSSAGDLTNNAFESTPPPGPGSSSDANGSYAPSGSHASSVPHPSGGFAGFPVDNVFVHDLKTGTTSLASVTTGGLLPNAASGGLIFSSDSGSLYFASSAIDLTSNPPDTSNGGPMYSTSPNNLFVRDLSAGTTSLISSTPDGQLSTSLTTAAILSPDGQTLYFDSDAADLTPGDSGQSTNIYAASAPFTTPDQFQFQSWESSAKESDGQAVVTVLRSGPATSAASVDYSVQGGTAQAGTDFRATSGTLNFAAGVTSQSFTVPLAAGDQFTGTRSATLVLSNPQGASLGYPSATLDLTSNATTSSTTPTTPTSTTPASPTSTIPAKPTNSSPMTPTGTPTTPTSTATTPTKNPTTPSPTPTTPVEPGPTVVSVAPLKGRRGITSLVITFDRALDPATAQDAANYQVSLPGPTMHAAHGHRSASRPSRSVRITAAAYDPANHQVTLTLRTKLRQGQATQLEIKGTTGGVTSTDGVPLNSPNKLKPGQNYLATLDVAARRA